MCVCGRGHIYIYVYVCVCKKFFVNYMSMKDADITDKYEAEGKANSLQRYELTLSIVVCAGFHYKFLKATH